MTPWVCLLGASAWGARAVARSNRRLAVIVPAGTAIPASVSAPADAVVVGDITDPDEVRALVDRLATGWGPPQLVVSFTELAQYSAARVATDLGLTTVSPEAVLATQDKARTRAALAGTPWDWPFHAGTAATVAARIGQVRQPWVVKPVNGAGSVGVRLIADQDALDRWSPDPHDLWIAEPLAGGREFSVEAVSTRRRHSIIGVTEKSTTGPHFVECGHVFPARLSPDDEHRIRATTHAVLDAVGLDFGASHTEIRLDPTHGAVVIETHTRPGGDSIPHLAHLVTGRDQYHEAINALLGEPPPTPETSTHGAAAIAFLLPPGPGTLTGMHIDRPEAEIVELTLTTPLGSEVDTVESSHDRLGHVIVTAGDAEKATARAVEVVRRVRIDVTRL